MNIKEKINNDIYSFIIKDWKNTSLVVDKFDNKCFSFFLNEIITHSLDKTELFFNYEAINILENSKINIEDKKHINDTLFKIYYEKTSFSSLNFSKKLIEHLSKKYNFINSLRPQGWESFILTTQKSNKIDINYYYNNLSKERLKNFNGHISEINENFYDNVSIFLTAHKKINHNIQPFENLIDSIVKYIAELNSIVNTKKIIDKIINNKDYSDDEFYIKCLNFRKSKLNFEVDLDNQKKKEDITKILKKISKN